MLKILYLPDESIIATNNVVRSHFSKFQTQHPYSEREYNSYSFGWNMSSLKTAYAAAAATPSPARIMRLYEAPSTNVTGFSGML